MSGNVKYVRGKRSSIGNTEWIFNALIKIRICERVPRVPRSYQIVFVILDFILDFTKNYFQRTCFRRDVIGRVCSLIHCKVSKKLLHIPNKRQIVRQAIEHPVIGLITVFAGV